MGAELTLIQMPLSLIISPWIDFSWAYKRLIYTIILAAFTVRIRTIPVVD